VWRSTWGSNRPAESLPPESATVWVYVTAEDRRTVVHEMSATRSATTWCRTIRRASGRRILRMAVVLHGVERDPRLKGDRPISRAKVLAPDVRIKPTRQHSVSCSITATSGESAFPRIRRRWVYDVHGSWNEDPHRPQDRPVRMKDGVPHRRIRRLRTASLSMMAMPGDARLRSVLNDGSLLFSDDGRT